MVEWINVKDRLPEPGIDVIIYGVCKEKTQVILSNLLKLCGMVLLIETLCPKTSKYHSTKRI